MHRDLKFLRVALSESEACRPSETASLGLADGKILRQSGYLDRYVFDVLLFLDSWLWKDLMLVLIVWNRVDVL